MKKNTNSFDIKKEIKKIELSDLPEDTKNKILQRLKNDLYIITRFSKLNKKPCPHCSHKGEMKIIRNVISCANCNRRIG